MAGVLTGTPTAGTAWATTRTLVRMRLALVRHAQGGSAMTATGVVLGALFALATLVLGLIPFGDPWRSVDLLASLILFWLIGWVMGPIAFRSGGQGLRPEYFALLPLPSRRLAVGLLGASFLGFSPVLTLVAFAAMVVLGARLGPAAFLASVPATLLELVVVVLLSKVVVAAMTATLNSRRGQDLGGLLMAVVIALASGGWSLASAMAQGLGTGPALALSLTLRLLPSGWGPVAVAAAGRADWALAAGALVGLAALTGALLLVWAALLERNMRRAGGQAARTAQVRGRPRTPRNGASSGGRAGAGTGGLQRLLHGRGQTGAVVVRELRAWRRDAGRWLVLVMALLIGVLNVGVPALLYDAPEALPWVGLAIALIAGMASVNLYGNDGTALWLTRMVPGSERADVRGRQLAWLLVVTPAVGAFSVVLTAASGQGWAWPWVLAALPAVLGGTAGLMVLVSVFLPIRQKDPHKRSGPFDTSDDPDATGAVVGQGYMMLGLMLLVAAPGCGLVLVGGLTGRPVLQWAGVGVGLAVGVALAWAGGRVAATRLADRGAELMDLLHLGPQAASAGTARKRADLPRRVAATVNLLWLAGILCIFPQGLVPICFNLFGVDPQVRVWFVARYAAPSLQVPVAVGFIALGALALWRARVLMRRHTQAR